MNKSDNKKQFNRERRRRRVRARVKGSSSRPRLSVFRSHAHILAQVINDEQGQTLAMALDYKLKGSKMERAQAVGRMVAGKALEKGIKTVVFDRDGFKYHGRVKALAEAAREAGLVF